jgi:hypothetical protein
MKRVAAILVAVGLVAGTFSSNEAVAADKPEAEVRVRVIQATNTGKKFDPDLEDLRKFLGQHKFSSFKQVIDETIVVGEKETKGIGLLSGKNLNVTLKTLTREKATIQLLLLGQTGQILDTTVAAGPNKLFFIAGPKYEDGVLFIAIQPQYDPEALGKVDVGSKAHD